MSSTRRLPYKPRLTREQRRRVIEDAAAALFAQRGYEAVSIDEIAAAARISKPTMYEHFAGKQALYRHLLRAQSQQMVDYMAQRVRTTRGTPHEQLREALDAFFGFVQEHPFAWRMLFREPPADPSLAEGAREIHQQATENVATMLRRMEPSKRRLSDGRLLLRAEGLKSAQQGLAAWWYEHPDVSREELVQAIIDISGLRIEAIE